MSHSRAAKQRRRKISNPKPLYKYTGIARQNSQTRNQASNGKAKRMHRTIINIFCSIVFAGSQLLNFWGDAAECATYISNRSLSKANANWLSPLLKLTKKVPVSSNIVAYRSLCTVHKNAKNKSLGACGKKGVIIGKSDIVKG